MPIVEIGMLCASALGLIISLLSGANVASIMYQKYKQVKRNEKHKKRAKVYKHTHTYVHAMAPVVFASICEYININKSAIKFSKTSSTTIQINVDGKVNTYNLPMSGCKICFNSFHAIKVYCSNEEHTKSLPDRFIVYYNDVDEFESWKATVIAPYFIKHEIMQKKINK